MLPSAWAPSSFAAAVNSAISWVVEPERASTLLMDDSKSAATEGVINLAAAAGEDLAQVSDIVTDNLTAFGLTAADTAHFLDRLEVRRHGDVLRIGIADFTQPGGDPGGDKGLLRRCKGVLHRSAEGLRTPGSLLLLEENQRRKEAAASRGR